MKTITRPTGNHVWQDPRAIALLFASGLTTMANATISPALPGLEAQLGTAPLGELLVRLLVPAPSLSIVLVASLAGLAVDHIGRRWMLIGGVLLYAVAGSAGLYLPDLNSILISRFGLGVAVAMIMTSQTALIGDYFSGSHRNSLMGLQISARNFAGMLCISLAGWLAILSPRLPFAIYGSALILLPLVWSVINEPESSVNNGTRKCNVGSPDTRNTGRWMPTVLGLAALQLLTSMGFFLIPTQLPFFLDQGGYESSMMTGLVMGTLTLTGGIAALLYGRLQRLAGYVVVYGGGYILMACGFGLLSLDGGLWPILTGAVFIGAGYALVMPGFVAITLEYVPANFRGRASGILTTSVFLGQVLSPLASIPAISTIGFSGTFAATAGFLGLFSFGGIVWHWSRVHKPRTSN